MKALNWIESKKKLAKDEIAILIIKHKPTHKCTAKLSWFARMFVAKFRIPLRCRVEKISTLQRYLAAATNTTLCINLQYMQLTKEEKKKIVNEKR